MKKVEKVSIAEISFTLDNDAYLSLKQYLDSLHDYYDKDPDGREIIADIEARIAELILEEQVYTKVVSKPLVDTVIAQLGTPEEIDDEVGEGTEAGFSGAAATPGSSAFDASIPRRLHRSAEGKIFGGVCSGLAKYLDLNVTWIRLIFLAPVILTIFSSPFHWHWFRDFTGGWSWVFFVIYIVLWIALPVAKTPRQKLEARGEKITPASIRQTMQGAASTPAGKKAASVAAELVNVLGRVVLFFVKFVMAVVGFAFLFAAISIFMCMFVILINPESGMISNGMNVISMFEGMAILSPVLFVELSLLCALLPLLVLGMALLSFTFSWRLGRVFYGVTLGTWGLSVIFFGIVAASNARLFHDELPHRVEWWHEDEWSRDTRKDDGEWRSGPGRVTVREDRDSLDGAALSVDAGSDSLVIVVKRDGTPNDTLVVGETPVHVGEGAGKATNETGGRRRVEVRRIEE